MFAVEFAVSDRPAAVSAVAPDESEIALQVGERMRVQDWQGARKALHRLPRQTLATPAMMFVDALLARRTGRLREAIDIYQRMLDTDASLTRVRLELADTYFEVGDDRSADHNYRLALSGEVPDQVREGVTARLRAISERRRWRYNVNLSVAPDSNVNAATDAKQLEIFGLPFELSDEARRTSGIGLTVAAGAERSWAVSDGVRLAFSAAGRFTDNEQKAFDDGQIGLQAGPQFWLGEANVQVSALGERRWFGGRPLSASGGASVSAKLGFDKIETRLAASAVHLDYDVGAARDAWVYSLNGERTRFMSPTRFWRASLAATRNDAVEPSEAFWLGYAAVGVYQTLPAGFTAWVEPSIQRRDYDARSFFGPEPRRDIEAGLYVRLIKRDWRVRAFSPYVAVQLSHNASNLDLEDYDRSRIEFGLTKTF